MRKLTKQEKIIVKKISESDHVYVDSLFSDVISKCKISCDFGKNEIKIHYLKNGSGRASSLQIPETTTKEIFIISKLLFLLDSNGLILTFEKAFNKVIDYSYSFGYDIKEPFSTYNFGDKRLKELFISYITLEIHPTEELRYFVKRSYRTQEEAYQNKTLTVSWVGIGLAIILGLTSNLKDWLSTNNEIEILNKKIDSIEQNNIETQDYIEHLKSENLKLISDTTRIDNGHVKK